MKNVFKLITLITIFVFLQHLTALSAVYLFNSGTETAPSGGGEVVKVNLPSSCTINLAAGTTDTIPLIQLLQQYCGATWTQSSTMKEPEGYYFTRDVKVVLEVAGGRGGHSISYGRIDGPGGKGGYTKIEFIISKNTIWNFNVHYAIGTAGYDGWAKGGGGGSIIVIGPPPYVEPGKYRFYKSKVIAIIAGGGGSGGFRYGRGGHGGGGNACGTRGSGKKGGAGGCQGKGGNSPFPADPNIVALCGGGAGKGADKVPGKGFYSGSYNGGGSTLTGIDPAPYYSVQPNNKGFGGGAYCADGFCYGQGGGGYGGGGGATYTNSGGGGGGAYCGFFGQPVGCSGKTGYNNGNGWGRITLIPQ